MTGSVSGATLMLFALSALFVRILSVYLSYFSFKSFLRLFMRLSCVLLPHARRRTGAWRSGTCSPIAAFPAGGEEERREIMEDRAILHSDLNSFYASVEIMLDPSLRGKPVAVCGSTEERHGIVLAKSDPAKRAGVKTGMVNYEARQLCPGLIVVPPQYDQYIKYSRLTQAIYRRYTDLVEPFGMDECWLDVTGSRALFGDPMHIAEEIRRTVREELGLTVSIGVSFNKIFAKLGSDMKKPDAITEITRDSFREKVWPLPVSDLLYCGPATTAKLKRFGIRTIGQMAQTSPDFMKRLLGVNGLALWRFANGADSSRVMHKDFESPIKSIGHGITCVADLEDETEVHRVMLSLCQDIGHRLRVNQLKASAVQVSVRCSDLSGYQFQCRLPCFTQLPSEIEAAAFRLFQERYVWYRKVRAVTVRATEVVPEDQPEQMDLFLDSRRRARRYCIQDAVEDIRGRYGKTSITYASLLGDLKMPDDGRDLVRMPGLMYQ